MTTNKDKHLHIRISEELKVQAEKMATQDSQKLSDWVRDLIKREVWMRSVGKKVY